MIHNSNLEALEIIFDQRKMLSIHYCPNCIAPLWALVWHPGAYECTQCGESWHLGESTL